jgi:hypothetical protein
MTEYQTLYNVCIFMSKLAVEAKTEKDFVFFGTCIFKRKMARFN